MRKSLVATLLATTLCSPLVFAASNPPATSASTAGQTGHQERHAASILDQLDLTDTQKKNVRQLMMQNIEQIRPEMQTLTQKRRAFETATPGSAEFQTAANDLAQAESNSAHARVLRQADLRTKIYNMLTPAQRTKLASIRTQREARIQQLRQSRAQKKPAPATSSR